MADYKRVVSYIYLYSHQLKGNNVGFARVETRGSQCKVTIHVRLPHIVDQTVKAYMYCWIDKAMHGIALGDLHIKDNTGDFTLTTDAKDICDSKYLLDEMSGILLNLSDTQFLGTEWDNREIAFDSFVVDEVKPKSVNHLVEQEEPKELQAAELHQEIVDEVEVLNELGEFVKQSDQSQIQEVLDVDGVVDKEQACIEEEDVELLAATGVAKQSGPEDLEELTPIWKGEKTWQEICQNQQSRMEPVKGMEFELPSKEIQEEVEKEMQQEMEEVESQFDDAFLEKEKMESLDMQAQELFGNMVDNLMAISNQMSNNQEDATVGAMGDMSMTPTEDAKPFVMSPKSAIECFTAFKSCESSEEYEEIQSEISMLKAQIIHLERISEEWLIRLARMEEEKAERAREKERLEAQLRESFHIDTDVFKEEEDGEIKQQSIGDEVQAEEINMAPVVARIFAKYPDMEPFQPDCDVKRCVRIEPQDIGIFPMENWILANNSFLLHGYYSYRHLIFLMCRSSDTIEYYLGVPGIRHTRESFMAKMFGFDSFRPIEQEEEDTSEFGYWCMPIYMPN